MSPTVDLDCEHGAAAVWLHARFHEFTSINCTTFLKARALYICGTSVMLLPQVQAKLEPSDWTDQLLVGEVDCDPVAGAATQQTPDNGPASAWKTSAAFLCKLGCVTAAGEVPPFQGRACKCTLSDDYTVTGYYFTMDEGGRPAGRPGDMIQVNHRDLVSLEPEVMGTVMGMSCAGPRPSDKSPTAEVMAELLAAGQQQQQAALVLGMGYRIDCFRPYLRRYVEASKEREWLPGQKGFIAGGLAVCLNQELEDGKLGGAAGAGHNWAEFKWQQLSTFFRCCNMGRIKKLNPHKQFLHAYVDAAVPALRQAMKPGGLIGDPAARRAAVAADVAAADGARHSGAQDEQEQQHQRPPRAPASPPAGDAGKPAVDGPRRSTRKVPPVHHGCNNATLPKLVVEQQEELKEKEEGGHGDVHLACASKPPSKRHKKGGTKSSSRIMADAQLAGGDMDAPVDTKVGSAERDGSMRSRTSQKCVEGLSAGMRQMAECTAFLREMYNSTMRKLEAENKALRARIRKLEGDSSSDDDDSSSSSEDDSGDEWGCDRRG